MDNYVWMKGTRAEIIAQLGEMTGITRLQARSDEYRFFEALFIDLLIDNHTSLLSPEEEFQIDIPRQYTAEQGLFTPEVNYFIGLKRVTYLLLFAVAEKTAVEKGADPVAAAYFFSMVRECVSKDEMAFLVKLNQALGESCIVLEAARHKKKGINKRFFPPKRGECINNHLDCKLREEEKCLCRQECAEQICEDLCGKKVLRKKDGSYFYTDFI